MKYNEALVLVEKMSKEQQEAGQREMMNRNTVFTRLKEYLDNKWNGKDSPLNKYQLKQKLNEYKRFEEIKKIGKNSRNKTDKNVKAYITKSFGKKPEWQIEKGENKMTYNSNNIPIIYQNNKNIPVGSKLETWNTTYNFENQIIIDVYNKLLAEHEYGHLYDWLKKYIETGKKERLSGTGNKNKTAASKEEGEADKYAFNNVYRKDRRDFLKHTEYTTKDLKADSENFSKMPYVDIEDEYNKIKNGFYKDPNKLVNKINDVKNYTRGLYNSGKYNNADNIIKTLNSIEKEKRWKKK